ncbi:MAG: hypothetical protein ACT4QG_02765 [Sporichthyaceae bacterium]
MASRRKRSISVPPEMDDAVEAAAAADGTTYSAWIAEAIRKQLILRDGLAAVAEYEAEAGAFTEAELAEADAWVTDALARAKRTGEPIRHPA